MIKCVIYRIWCNAELIIEKVIIRKLSILFIIVNLFFRVSASECLTSSGGCGKTKKWTNLHAGSKVRFETFNFWGRVFFFFAFNDRSTKFLWNPWEIKSYNKLTVVNIKVQPPYILYGKASQHFMAKLFYKPSFFIMNILFVSREIKHCELIFNLQLVKQKLRIK